MKIEANLLSYHSIAPSITDCARIINLPEGLPSGETLWNHHNGFFTQSLWDGVKIEQRRLKELLGAKEIEAIDGSL